MSSWAVAGFGVGIICLETGHRLLPGNVQHAGSFAFPVMYETVKVETPWDLMNGNPALAEPILAAARRLQDRGVPAIAGACGSFGYYQRMAAEALEVPVFLSILTQIPFLLQALPQRRKIGVLCAVATAMNDTIYEACGIDEPERLSIGEMVGYPQFQRMLRAESFDTRTLELEAIDAASALAAKGDVAAILLQCSDLPPFAHSIQRAVGLPVYDMSLLIRWIGSGTNYCPYL